MQICSINACSNTLISLGNASGGSIFGLLKKHIPAFPLKVDTSGLILQIMQSNPCFFENYIDSSKAFEIQAIYTQIDRDSINRPSFRQYSYRLNDKEYFCPASTSKLPVLLMALEKLKKLNSMGIDKYTAMNFDSLKPCQKAAYKDTVAEDSILNIAHFIQKILLVSENDSYNRLFEFVGQKAVNKRLWKMGFKKSCIIQQFNSCNADDNRYSNPFSFIDKNGKKIYSQPQVKNRRKYKNPLGKVVKGIGYLDNDGKLIRQPRDFKYYNNIPLKDLHDIMLRTIFPDAFTTEQQFQINQSDYCFLYKYMSMLPRESDFHKYHDTIRYPDNRKKYLIYGTDTFRHIIDSTIRIFNIVGQLSGYLTDCAYIVDFKNNVEFILAVTIYNNQSGIFDVSNYRYKTLGFPFLQEFGRSIYNYELTRPKKFKPDLSYLKKCIDNPVK
jgi:Beta-lactamase enzyme family